MNPRIKNHHQKMLGQLVRGGRGNGIAKGEVSVNTAFKIERSVGPEVNPMATESCGV